MAGAQAGLEVLNKALEVGTNALDNISDYYFENEAMIAWWNDWNARDQRAHIEKTFNHGRFSREKRTLGSEIVDSGAPNESSGTIMATKQPNNKYCYFYWLASVPHIPRRNMSELPFPSKVLVKISQPANIRVKFTCTSQGPKKEVEECNELLESFDKILGIVNGRWYCCFTQAGLQAKGQPLD